MRTHLVAVVGSGRSIGDELTQQAEALGAALVARGWGLVTGGRGGVMEAVSRGAAKARGERRHPPILGILPSYDADTANKFVDVALPTGMAHARNALVAAAGEAVVCLGGATGALSEVALARKIGRPVIALAPSGGAASLAARAISSIFRAATIEEVIARLDEILG